MLEWMKRQIAMHWAGKDLWKKILMREKTDIIIDDQNLLENLHRRQSQLVLREQD